MEFKWKKVLCLLLTVAFLATPVSALTERQSSWFKMMENDFVAKGRGIDQDGYAGFQCVDLVNNYVTNLFPDANLGNKAYSKSIGFGNARELYAAASDAYFEKIPFVDGMVPRSGDIAVWGKAGTGFTSSGHVGIVYYADKSNLVMLHQDGYGRPYVFKEESGYNRLYNYNGALIGFLRPRDSKIKEINPSMPIEKYEVEMAQNGQIKVDLNDEKYRALVDLKLISPSQTQSAADALDRLQAVVLVTRLSGNEQLVKKISEEDLIRGLANISDLDEIPNWARPYVAFAINEGIISGVSKTADNKIVFGPNEPISGAVFSTILFRSLGYEVNDLGKANEIYKNMISYYNASELNYENIVVNPKAAATSSQKPEELRAVSKPLEELAPAAKKGEVNLQDTAIDLVAKDRVSRNDAAKIMYDVLAYANAVENGKLSKLTLKEYLVQKQVFEKDLLMKALKQK